MLAANRIFLRADEMNVDARADVEGVELEGGGIKGSRSPESVNPVPPGRLNRTGRIEIVAVLLVGKVQPRSNNRDSAHAARFQHSGLCQFAQAEIQRVVRPQIRVQ